MSEPLHIQVSRLMGWTDLQEREDGLWFGEVGGVRSQIPRYDRSWCSAGPLISRYQILLGPEYDVTDAGLVYSGQWGAKLGAERINATIVYGTTPTEAVAKLIVQLHSEGKLPND